MHKLRKLFPPVLSLCLLLTACSGQTASSTLVPQKNITSTTEETTAATTVDPATVNPLTQMSVTPYAVPVEAFNIEKTETWERWPAVSSLPFELHIDMSVYKNRQMNNRPLEGVTVILDPGHGGKDPGAVAQDAAGNKITEKELNLPIALKTKAALEQLGARVIMTRAADTWSSLYQRVALAGNASLEQWVQASANSGADATWINPLIENLQKIYDINEDTVASGGRGFFQGMGVTPEVRTLFDAQAQTPNIIYISIHCNSSEFHPDSAQGLQVYYCTNDSMYTAENTSITTRPDDPDIIPFNPNYQLYNDQAREKLAQEIFVATTRKVPALHNAEVAGVRTGNYAFIREMNISSILLECGYMSHPGDLAILQEEANQQKLADGITEAVYNYFCQPD